MSVGNLVWQQEEARKGDNSGKILYIRALQGHSGHNLIDPSLQDIVMIESEVFHHIYTLDVHSIFTLLSTMD